MLSQDLSRSTITKIASIDWTQNRKHFWWIILFSSPPPTYEVGYLFVSEELTPRDAK